MLEKENKISLLDKDLTNCKNELREREKDRTKCKTELGEREKRLDAAQQAQVEMITISLEGNLAVTCRMRTTPCGSVNSYLCFFLSGDYAVRD